jgi:hypothetical protein
LKIGGVLFVHGGILPQHLEAWGGNIHTINTIARKYLRKQPMTESETQLLYSTVIGENGILWTRLYAALGNDQAALRPILDDVLVATNCNMICTGHNTVDRITPVCGGKLWFLDAGFSRAYGTSKFQILEIRDNGTEFSIAEIVPDIKK